VGGEARFYGFRPGRGCADAIAALFTTLKGRQKVFTVLRETIPLAV
jgi:retron-type reverse transcriptase